jgi:gamma-glutamyltranspeptidase / glutathione hydrolase
MILSRLLAGVAGMVLLAGCSLDLGDTLGGGGSSIKGGAQVVGDEPNAVKAGASVLAQSGSAVDAVTAMYFTLASTYPQAAGLGGGGVCIVRDVKKGIAEEFSFLPKKASGGGEYAVPGNVRGFAAMQSAYGSLPWRKVVAIGESHARAGFALTRALRSRLGDAEGTVRLDADLAREFMDESGKLKEAGKTVAAPDLAATLAAIRTEGANAFYTGRIAAAIAAYTSAQGGAITVADLGDYKVGRATPRVMQVGGNYVYLPVAGKGVGVFAAALIDAVARGGDGQALSDVAQKTLTGLGLQNQGGDRGATGFAATDTNDQTVACAVTMNGSFGSGRSVPGIGVTLARAPVAGDAVASTVFLAPVIASSGADAPAVLTGVGAGGAGGSAALVDTLSKLARGQTILTRNELRTAGQGASSSDTVNAIVCNGTACAALSDPAAYGFGLTVPFDEK